MEQAKLGNFMWILLMVFIQIFFDRYKSLISVSKKYKITDTIISNELYIKKNGPLW